MTFFTFFFLLGQVTLPRGPAMTSQALELTIVLSISEYGNYRTLCIVAINLKIIKNLI